MLVLQLLHITSRRLASRTKYIVPPLARKQVINLIGTFRSPSPILASVTIEYEWRLYIILHLLFHRPLHQDSRAMECEEVSSRISVAMGLGGLEHQDALTRAINNILNTDIAETTLAQIVDGLPLADVAQDSKSPHPPKGHPVYAHTELCAGVIEKTHELRQALNFGHLTFEAGVSSLLHRICTTANT